MLLLLLSLISPPSLSGTVESADHKPIAAAVVTVQQGGRTFTATTDAAGKFTLPEVTLPAMVEVVADHYTDLNENVLSSPVVLTLHPLKMITETVHVDGPSWGDPVTGTIELRDELRFAPAVTLDESLRVLSGLSLFRRSPASASNPTTHGVTMRGLSASGSSRGLVLLDGISFTDGFGGWVMWTRLPALATDQVEVDRGAKGAMFGSDALGGVINITSHNGYDGRGTAVALTGGSDGLKSVDASSGGWTGRDSRLGRFEWFGAASWFKTDGDIPVAPESRGLVDSRADAEWSNALLKLGFQTPSAGGFFHHLTLTAWGGEDDRGNGTVQQRNHMKGGTAALGYSGGFLGTQLTARVSGSPNTFKQTFSSVAAGRATETLTSTQFVDASTTRVAVEATHAVPKGLVSAAFQLNRASATFTEVKPTSTSNVAVIDDGEALIVHTGWSPLASVTIGAAARYEWREAPFASGARDTAAVGNVSAAWRLNESFSIRGSLATSHRWPTLNELVRNFQVGSVLTLANPDLAPERARSADLALMVEKWSVFNVSLAGFWTTVEDAIANVTTQSTPTIIRQRRNAGAAESHGLELEVRTRVRDVADVHLSATLVDARFRRSLEPALEGNRLPQVPRSSFSISGDTRLLGKWLQAAAIYRWIAPQFDDDRNVFELAQASEFNIRLFGTIGSGFGWQITAGNATNERIEVGKTPLVTLATGRSIRAGITWRR